MNNTDLSTSSGDYVLESLEGRIDILLNELELASKWRRPSVLLAVYSSEYVREEVDKTLENRLKALGQKPQRIKITNQEGSDIALRISEVLPSKDVVFFIEGLRWGTDQGNSYVYSKLNNSLDFFMENRVKAVFWLTEKEARDLAHHAPDYWSFRHKVIEFVDLPQPDQITPHDLPSTWQGSEDFTTSIVDLDAKIAFRTSLLNELPSGDESTSIRANLLLTLGMLHWRRREFEKASQNLNIALDLAAKLEDAHFEALCFNAFALVQTAQGRIEDAIQAFQNAVQLAPEEIVPWNNLGHLFKKLERHADALSAFQRALEQSASDGMSWLGLGDVYFETGQIEEAINSYRKATEYCSDYAVAWSNLGMAYINSRQLEEAFAAHKKALEIDRRMVKSWLGLGVIFKQQGNNENARLAFHTALALDPNNPHAMKEIENTKIHAREKEPVTLKWLDGLASVMPVVLQHPMDDSYGDFPSDSKDSQISRIGSKTQTAKKTNAPVNETGIPKETVNFINENLSLAYDLPEDASTGNDSREAAVEDRSTEVEEPAPNSYLESDNESQPTIDKKNAQIWNELGNMYFNTDAIDEATHAFKMAIDLDPTCEMLYHNLASVYIHNKHYEDAISLYDKGLQLSNDPRERAQFWNHLGDIYRHLNHRDQAALAYRKAITSDPDNISLMTRARFSLLENPRV